VASRRLGSHGGGRLLGRPFDLRLKSPVSSFRASPLLRAGHGRDYWTKELREAEAELDVATKRSDLNAAASGCSAPDLS
jgi:hypothetical protein